MSIADMQRFAELRAAGDPTVADRLAMLREQRTGLADRIRSLEQTADALDEKINHYEQLLAEQRKTDQT